MFFLNAPLPRKRLIYYHSAIQLKDSFVCILLKNSDKKCEIYIPLTKLDTIILISMHLLRFFKLFVLSNQILSRKNQKEINLRTYVMS